MRSEPLATEAISVSAFTRQIKAVLESSVPAAWVRGEVTNVRAQGSGHVYFSLKDAGAQLSAVLFRGDALRQTVKLRDGLQVIAYGQVGVYEARGSYQLIVRTLVEDGVGRLQREFEALKARLAAEGLFDAERKKPIPPMPATVGFVTSPTGAAVQDFLRILLRRGWRGRVVILPAKVQGEGSAQDVADMIALAEKLGIFDLLVVGRGGGSLEDLWAFNEEVLVRAVATSTIPIISAVGHEIDFTLSDFAADVRAETPSAAAELISSHFVEAIERVDRAKAGIENALNRARQSARERLSHAGSRLRLLTPAAQVERGYLRLDDLSNRLAAALGHAAQLRRRELNDSRARFLRASPERRVELASHRLLSLWKRLQASSPASVLNRGFVIMRDEAGQPVIRAAGAAESQRLTAEFADGTIVVKVTAP